MPGKNTQDWTADEDFWNEAWGDMEQRLDGKRKRRGMALWLRWLVPLVLLLAGAGFIVARQGTLSPNQDQPATGQEEETQAIASSPSAIIPADDLVVNEPKPAKAEVDNTSTQAALHSEERPFSNANTIKKTSSSTTTVPKSLQMAQTTDADLSPASPDVSPPAPLATNIASTSEPGLAEASPAAAPESSEKQNSDVLLSPEEDAAADQLTERSAPVMATDLLATPDYKLSSPQALPSVTFRKAARPLPFGIEAGVLLADHDFLPGYYAGIFTELRADKKVSFPLSLLYRTDRLRIEVGRRNTRDEALQDVGLSINTGQSFNSPYYVTEQPLDELRVTSLTLSTGASFRMLPRLRAGFGISGSYLLSARGITDLSFENDVYNFVVSSDDSPELFNGSGQTPAAETVRLQQSSSLSLSDNNGLHRVQMAGHFNLRYALLPHLDLTGSVDVRTTPLFKSDLLRIRPTQFSLGMRYRLR